MKKISQLFIFIPLFIMGCQNEDVIDIPLTAETRTDVSYGAHPDQSYDIFLPNGRQKNKTKTLLFIHGGGWTEGDKSDLDDIIGFLKPNLTEYAIVNMNYRLASVGNSPFPMQLDDIQLLIDHLKTNGDELQIKNEYLLIGASAGAHLSMLYAYDKDPNALVKGVASIVGPTNLTDPAYTNPTNLAFAFLFQAIQNITGVQFQTNPDYYLNVSPLYKATTNSPPTILFYGGLDPLIPNSQGTALHAKLNELGVYNEFIFYPEEGHGWVGQNLLDTLSKLEAFILNELN